MSRLPFTKVRGSITAPKGFRAAGVAAGIKASGAKDLALIVSDRPAVAAAVFTTNQVKAAPVVYNQRHVNTGTAQAIVANSGNANACTGYVGMIHARAMAAAVARRIGCDEDRVFVCSTGRIGVRLPSVKIQAGIKKLLGMLSPSGGHAAAEAIMTTDSFPKECAVRFKAGNHLITVGGIAKGAGMIHPNMATMLAFLTTDAAVTHAPLQRALTNAVNQSFNRISVDGDMSTNDSVLLLANGEAGNKPLTGKVWTEFEEALSFVCLELAKLIMRDGEGVSRFITVTVDGAVDDRDAEIAARSVCNSVLVKTSWCGGDPNWGRIMDALGYSAAKVQESKIEIAYNGVPAVANGMPARTPVEKLKKIVAQPEFQIDIHMHLGRGRCTMFTCDLTEKYVEFNKGE